MWNQPQKRDINPKPWCMCHRNECDNLYTGNPNQFDAKTDGFRSRFSQENESIECAPLNIVISIINHSYWSYVHQLSYRKRGPHIVSSALRNSRWQRSQEQLVELETAVEEAKAKVLPSLLEEYEADGGARAAAGWGPQWIAFSCHS